MTNDFYPGMKVYLKGESGVVTKDFIEDDGVYFVNGIKKQRETSKLFGMIRWDTNKEFDLEDWRGLYGSFIDIGGKELPSDYTFKFIDDEGNLK